RAAAARSGDERRGGGRLQLDLLDPATERVPHLRMASRLERPAVPADPAAREAAAALWQALRRTPDEAVQQGSRLLALERDLGSLRTITEQNAAAVSQMRQQVERARSDRDQVSGLMFALLAALAALVGWMVWQWRRSPRPEAVPQWFDDLPSRPPAATPEPQAPEPALRTMPEPVHAAVSRPSATVSLLRPSVAEAVAQAGGNSAWGQVEPSDFQPSVGGTVRMVGVQELIDVHDKAHFFLALGQPEQAMEVLDAHVHDQVETSALAWMDLLELYHRFGKHDAFEHLRTEFLERFAVQMPDFEHFDQPSKPLEEYGRALSRIVALWPTRRVLNVIEESIFRKPGLPGADPFSLEAYRDLVLLYHVARDIAPAEDSGGVPLDYKSTDFPSTSLQPLNALDTRHPSMEEATVVMGRSDPEGDDQPWGREQLMVPPSSPRIGLDIDLDSIPQEAEALQVEEDEDPWGRYEPAAPPVMPSRILDFDVTGLELVDDEPRRKRRR
ncbi:MAG TPA: hypothetical protein VLK85_02565, partial [Ramlibacter sp.]|nr:hypothetical protein [Ramlibacter sp.]